MTSRLRRLWVALAAAGAIAAVFTTPAILAGIVFNSID
jgi:H+/Cl- antiporter ClcA